MKAPNANTWRVAINTLMERAWLLAHAKGQRHGYTQYDISIAYTVELRAAGLEVRWIKGRKPHASDVRDVIDGARTTAASARIKAATDSLKLEGN